MFVSVYGSTKQDCGSGSICKSIDHSKTRRTCLMDLRVNKLGRTKNIFMFCMIIEIAELCHITLNSTLNLWECLMSIVYHECFFTSNCTTLGHYKKVTITIRNKKKHNKLFICTCKLINRRKFFFTGKYATLI